MSWLARSIANSLNLDDEETETETSPAKPINPESSSSSPRGVKDDLSELTTTLTRQFWGVASFLAPPPSDPRSESESDSVSGIKTDFVEIGEKFRTGISRLSNNINVSEITKVASTFLQLDDDDDDDDVVVGVNDDVVSFVTDLALHPETWLDFPLPDNVVDFGISDVQQEHALAIERLVPEVAALKNQLCPGYMTESCFWMIYFLLVLPRLDKQDAEILSTPQIVKARELLAPESKNQTTFKQPDDSGKQHLDSDGSSGSHREESSVQSPSPEKETGDASDLETTKTNEIQITEKSFAEENDVEQIKDQIVKSGPSNVTEVNDDDDEDEADAWLQEEEDEDVSIEVRGDSSTTKVPNVDDDEVSFSDLEEDDDVDVPTSYRKSNDSSDKDSKDWVTIE